ncbi:MAG: hypothetical protein IPP48_10630 [Chitinophagaceae bacterium]|nr:hypothetical protein [Chitinophagaceae bacterium]
MKHLLFCFLSLTTLVLTAQDKKPKVEVSGTMGVTYEGYGLNRNPTGWTGFAQRKPWNQVRFTFQPTITTPKWSLPFNFNFNTTPTNVIGPYANIGKQNIGQYITNPSNNFAFNPKYKWAELQLGTQYLNYSNLSTGDVGVFGAGVDLRPNVWRIKFFTGVSQQGINFFSGGPGGSYKRNNWMAQLGMEKEDKYALLFNFAKGKDDIGSVTTPPPGILPQEGFTMSVVGKANFKGGWYFTTEGAQSIYTKDLTLPVSPTSLSQKPFLEGNTSTIKDFAAEGGIGRKSKNFDIGAKVKYLGAGFQTVGYPFMQPDRIDYTLNTRFNAFKNKTNVTASIGQRVNNVSSTALKAKQFIGNLNWFSQINDHWSVNINYNNFGFQSNSGLNPYGIKNVSNDFGVSPTYTWSNTKMAHLLSLSYNYSKYDERDVITGLTTSNNTHTALLTYVPSYLTKDLTPDFSVMYFLNKLPGFKTTLVTLSTGLALPAMKKKVQLRGQLQYTFSKNNTFTANNNFIASCNVDAKLSKKLTWTNYLSTNYFKYGNEILPNGANYLESNIRTGLMYRFGK